MFFAGMAKGFNEAMTSDRQLQAQKDEAQAQRENAILTHLSTSDDPEIASMAITGLLNQQRKPSKGLRGFLGEMQGNPMLPTIRELIGKGRQVPNTGAPEPNAPPEAPAPPAGIAAPGSAALPAGSPVEPGANPMRALASPPPGPVQFHEGPSVGTHTVPRRAFMDPVEKARAIEEAQVGGKTSALLAGVRSAQTPEERAVALAQGGVHPSTMPRFVPGTVPGARLLAGEPDAKDIDGTPIDPKGFYRTQIHVDPVTGAQTRLHTPTTPPPTAKPSGPEAAALERAQEILAERQAKGLPPLSGEAAVAQARTENRVRVEGQTQQKTALDAARLDALHASATATWQRVHGTTPMTDEQAWTVSRQTLGNGPDVTPGMIEELHNSLRAGGRAGGAAVAPPAAGAGAGTPPPGASVIPANLRDQARAPKFYSQMGKRTIQAVEVMRPMLTKLVAAIKAEGLEDDGSALGTGINNKLQQWGISPGTLQTEMMQLASVAEANGFSTFSVGRMNIPVINILKGHLTDPGDSYKLLYDKANGLLEKFPDIKQAVDTAENMRVGGQGRTGTTPPQPVYAWDSQGVRHIQTDPKAALPTGWTSTPPR